MSEGAQPLLSCRLVERTYAHRRFGHREQSVRALAGVSVDIWAHRSVGIIGESGSGKSTLLRVLLGLERPDSGEVTFQGAPLDQMNRSQMRSYRRGVQAVFQDSTSVFDPRRPLWDSVTEPLWMADRTGNAQRKKVAASLLKDLGVVAGAENRYPRALSGGERQRAAIARSLSAEPEIVLLDEPVSALDVSVRGAVINLLNAIARSRQLTYLVVSHDLTAVYYLTEYTYVMLKGSIVEEGPTLSIVAAPEHPYTKRLVQGLLDPLAPASDDDLEPQSGTPAGFLPT